MTKFYESSPCGEPTPCIGVKDVWGGGHMYVLLLLRSMSAPAQNSVMPSRVQLHVIFSKAPYPNECSLSDIAFFAYRNAFKKLL